MDATQYQDQPHVRRAQTRRAVEGVAAHDAPYLLMNAAATLIAGFGLFEDSPAVIIGAMLIAALLGPIQGLAMALAESDLKLLRVSLTAEVVGATLVLVLGIALGTIDRASPLGHEILSRTAPNILDLLIGLVGGAAASFATATPRLGSLAVGVAIATALVPPLTTCGILIARGLPALAAGAFLLFFANFVAITFSAMIMFMILGHRATIAAPTGAGRGAIVPRLVCLVIALALGFHLFNVFQRTFGQETLRSKTRQVVEHELLQFPGSNLVAVTLNDRFGLTSVVVVVKSPHPFTSADVGHMNDMINAVFGEPVELHLRSEMAVETTRDGAHPPRYRGLTRDPQSASRPLVRTAVPSRYRRLVGAVVLGFGLLGILAARLDDQQLRALRGLRALAEILE
jgi:uncharacterized hydrophobic protein (TIGR00271 family)